MAAEVNTHRSNGDDLSHTNGYHDAGDDYSRNDGDINGHNDSYRQDDQDERENNNYSNNDANKSARDPNNSGSGGQYQIGQVLSACSYLDKPVHHNVTL